MDYGKYAKKDSSGEPAKVSRTKAIPITEPCKLCGHSGITFRGIYNGLSTWLCTACIRKI